MPKAKNVRHDQRTVGTDTHGKPDAVRLEPLDLTQLLRDTLQDYRLLASQQDIRLTADLPDHATPIRGHAILLQRAVGNLLDNALKFTRSTILLSLQENRIPT